MAERWTPAYDRLFDPGHHLADDAACRRWAWLDLCHMARWEDGVRVIGGSVVELRRGELLASIRYLAERWDWSKDKVRRFLRVLEHEAVHKISTERATPHGTVYRIVRYDDYANPRDGDGTPSAPGTGRGRDGNGTRTGQTTTGIHKGTSGSRGTRDPDGGGSPGDVENPEDSTDRDQLADWLGQHENGVVDRFVAADDANGSAVRSIWATYATRSMAGERIWKDTPDEERKIVLADVLETLAGEGKRYQANFFRRILQDRLAEGIGGDRPGSGRRAGADDRAFTDEEWAEYLDIRRELEDGGMEPDAAAEKAMRRVQGALSA